MSKISDLRQEYKKSSLLEVDVTPNPMDQFKIWFDEALKSEINEPNAFILSTVDALHYPSARVVLLKGQDERGFVFYTNYNSHKAQEIAGNPNVSMTFLWHELERQIRINGTIVKVSREESQEYFHSRPRASQIGAWASPQSEVISSRESLDEQLNFYVDKFKDDDNIPIPEHWGGYLVIPNSIEFWQGRRSRLHDRLRYHKMGESWKLVRLAP